MSEISAVEDRTLPAVCYGLYFLGFATGGLTTLIGVAIAYAQRARSAPVAQSHYTFLIRTFWLGFVWMFVGAMLLLLGLPLMIVLIGFPMVMLAKLVFGLGAVWYAVRLVVGVIHLSRDEAHPRPYAVLA